VYGVSEYSLFVRNVEAIRDGCDIRIGVCCFYLQECWWLRALPQESEIILGSGQYRERFYERAVKKKVFSMPPTVLGS
jgi:hypothetical protein